MVLHVAGMNLPASCALQGLTGTHGFEFGLAKHQPNQHTSAKGLILIRQYEAPGIEDIDHGERTTPVHEESVQICDWQYRHIHQNEAANPVASPWHQSEEARLELELSTCYVRNSAGLHADLGSIWIPWVWAMMRPLQESPHQSTWTPAFVKLHCGHHWKEAKSQGHEHIWA